MTTPWGGKKHDPRPDAEKAAAFDPLALHADYLDDPYPAYRILRENDPVHRCPDGSYFLTRYVDLLQVYKGVEFTSDKSRQFEPKIRLGKPPLQTSYD